MSQPSPEAPRPSGPATSSPAARSVDATAVPSRPPPIIPIRAPSSMNGKLARLMRMSGYGRPPLHFDFDHKALRISIDGREGEQLPVLLEARGEVPLVGVAVGHDPIPVLGVADVVDGDVVVCAPEERHEGEPLVRPQDVASRGLAHAFGDNPVFDANSLASMWIRPARDVSRRKNTGCAGLEVFVDAHAA